MQVLPASFPTFHVGLPQSNSSYLSHQVADKNVPAIYKQLHSISELKIFFPLFWVYSQRSYHQKQAV